MIRKYLSITREKIPWMFLIFGLLTMGRFLPAELNQTIAHNPAAEVSLESRKSPKLSNDLHRQPIMTHTTNLLIPLRTKIATKTHTSTSTQRPQKQTPTSTEIPPITPSVTTTQTVEIVSDPEEFPESVMIDGVRGFAQSFPLDCESRSAVDLAAFFGVKIEELDFQMKLPESDDPEEGFVGDYTDPSGKTPPESYGVHAPPVAKLLRNYGLNADAAKFLSWEDLQKDIASGHPVMVWVVNNQLGKPISYTSSSGNTTVVARFEHTVLITGYNPDYVYIQDGGYYYARTINRFLESWSILQFMAVQIGHPPVMIDRFETTNSRH